MLVIMKRGMEMKEKIAFFLFKDNDQIITNIDVLYENVVVVAAWKWK